MKQRYAYPGSQASDTRADEALVTRIILAGVDVVARDTGPDPVIAVEVGCSVHPHASLTTASIASALRRLRGDRRFYSIDWDQERLDESARMLAGFPGDLVAEVTPVCGDGSVALAGVIATEGRIDFACLDGNRDASLCLAEFDTILPALSPRGLVIVPGLDDLSAGPDMTAVWPLGRGSLILARLLADSASALRACGNEPADPEHALAFFVVAARDARVLVAGRPDTIDAFAADVRSLGMRCSDARTAAARTHAPQGPAWSPERADRAPAARLDARPPHHDIDVHLQAGWRGQHQVFPDVTPDDFAAAIRAALLVERRIMGRHCGDLADRLSQYLAVAQFVRQTRAACVDTLEIGTLFGGSCLMALTAMRDLGVIGTVTCIDPLTGYYDVTSDPTSGVPVSAGTLYRNLESCGFGPDRIDLRACLSSDPAAIEGLDPGHFGVVLIDGDHTMSGVGADWHRFSPLVADRGLLLLDDYGEPAWPDVTLFADTRAAADPEWRRAGCLGTTLVLCRRSNPLSFGLAEPETDPVDGKEPVDLLARLQTRAGDAPPDEVDVDALARHLRMTTEACPELGLARTAAKRAGWDRAEDLFMVAASRAGVSPVVTIQGWLGAANCRSARKDYAGSGELLREAAALEDQLRTCGYHRVDALARLARLVDGRGHADDAIRMCQEALQQAELSGPSKHDLHVAIGHIELRRGAFGPALDHFAASLRFGGLGGRRECFGWLGQGLTLACLGRQSDAARAFETAIGCARGATPPVPADRLCEGYLGWARALDRLHQGGRAAAVCRQALASGVMTGALQAALREQLDRLREGELETAGAAR